ncbi:MAG TPA: DUF6157 family protein [Flavobacteriaceae bacterium]|nr:DUF6157 family protein [Flavobacteriaceae bacterium]
MGYKNTFIKVAEDCPVTKSEIPVSSREKIPIHIFQYELLSKHPYKLGHEELVFEVYLKQNGFPENISDAEAEKIREQLFSKGHPCMRASALTKRYGFGAHYDEDGKIALYPMESEEYRTFLKNASIEKVVAMRRKKS